MKSPRTLAIALGAILLLGVGFLFFRSPKPIIEIKAETLADIGPSPSSIPLRWLLPFPLVNTYVTSLTVVVLLIVIAVLIRRRMSLVPGRLQNAVEGLPYVGMEAFYDIAVNTAGEKNGRRFFPAIFTIFVFIWVANWMALLPFFNTIGSVEKVDAHEFHKEAAAFSKTAGIRLITPNQKELTFEVNESSCAPIDKEISDATAAKRSTSGLEKEKEDCIVHARQRAIDVQLPKAAGIQVDTSACNAMAAGTPKDACVEDAKLARADEARAKLEKDGTEIGILKPYFRSMNTDINSPLSMAIMAIIFVEFWGITALGFFKYGSKFINFSSPINTIVGLLELIAEAARLISFTFRLFGNMLAGEILLLVMTFIVPFVFTVLFYGLEVFVGLIQAFVFAMLTLVFGVLAVSVHEEHGEQGEVVEEPVGQV